MMPIKSNPAGMTTELVVTHHGPWERDWALPLILLTIATLTAFMSWGCALWLSDLVVDIVFMSTTLHHPSDILGR